MFGLLIYFIYIFMYMSSIKIENIGLSMVNILYLIVCLGLIFINFLLLNLYSCLFPFNTDIFVNHFYIFTNLYQMYLFQYPLQIFDFIFSILFVVNILYLIVCLGLIFINFLLLNLYSCLFPFNTDIFVNHFYIFANLCKMYLFLFIKNKVSILFILLISLIIIIEYYINFFIHYISVIQLFTLNLI